jgi:SAM-dependent methyltransferase
MHFDTRERFFGEALRVLRPGGRLLLADIIATPQLGLGNVTNVAEYARALELAGFGEVRVLDVTRDVCYAHVDYCLWHLRDRLHRNTIDQRRFDLAAIGQVARLAATKYYVVASARKRLQDAPAWRSAPHTGEYLSSLLISTARV